ncbi:hypothetical protein [Dermacoccus nishinomiyaensis]|uniref:hypothetical protein n=1 Tax=Dermacoccus nishinomiyaensis TaxID=1274 RepID=UPI00289C5204|nr:hypothetical protein [Dermacoccus nishinomiyaensis]
MAEAQRERQRTVGSHEPEQHANVAAEHARRELHRVLVVAPLDVLGPLAGTAVDVAARVVLVEVEQLLDETHARGAHFRRHLHDTEGRHDDEPDAMDGRQLRLHDTAPVFERQIGEDEHEIPVLVEHPITCRLDEVEGRDGRFGETIFDDDEVPLDLRVLRRERRRHVGRERRARQRCG